MSYQTMKWHAVNLICLLLSKRSQYEKVIHHMITTIWLFGKWENINRVKRSAAAGLREEHIRIEHKELKIFGDIFNIGRMPLNIS